MCVFLRLGVTGTPPGFFKTCLFHLVQGGTRARANGRIGGAWRTADSAVVVALRAGRGGVASIVVFLDVKCSTRVRGRSDFLSFFCYFFVEKR